MQRLRGSCYDNQTLTYEKKSGAIQKHKERKVLKNVRIMKGHRKKWGFTLKYIKLAAISDSEWRAFKNCLYGLKIYEN